jgi:hypothetical protein
MTYSHLTDNEMLSLINNNTQDKTSAQLIDVIESLSERVEQAQVDTQDALDDIANTLDEFNTAYATVSNDIDTTITDEYSAELKLLRDTVTNYL